MNLKDFEAKFFELIEYLIKIFDFTISIIYIIIYIYVTLFKILV